MRKMENDISGFIVPVSCMYMLKGNRMIDKVYVPPIKIQGIKTKIVPLISEVAWIDKEYNLG